MYHQSENADSLEAKLTEIDESRTRAQQTLRDHERLLNSRAAEIRAMIDEANLKARPAYPTRAHIDCVAAVADLIHAQADFGGRRGEALDDLGSVYFSSEEQRLDVFTLAPERRVGGGHLWQFTDEEHEAFRRLFDSHSIRISSTRHYTGGFSVIVTSKKV